MKAPTLLEQIDVLHAYYVEQVNRAVADGSDQTVRDLVVQYDADALRLVAEHEGRLDLLVGFGQRRPNCRSRMRPTILHRRRRHIGGR